MPRSTKSHQVVASKVHVCGITNEVHINTTISSVRESASVACYEVDLDLTLRGLYDT